MDNPPDIGHMQRHLRPGESLRTRDPMYTRREIVQTGAFFLLTAGTTALHRLGSYDLELYNTIYKDHPEIGEALRKLHSHPVATYKTFEKPDPNCPSLFVHIDDNGIVSTQTLHSLQENGALAHMKKSRRESPSTFETPDEPDPDIVHSHGTGCVTMHMGEPLLVSNEHVLKCAVKELEEKMLLRESPVDIGAMSMHDVERGEVLPSVRVSPHLKGDDMPGRTVKLHGFGADEFEVEGVVGELPEVLQRVHCTGCYQLAEPEKGQKPVRHFFIRIPADFYYNRAIMKGMSGSPIIDTETGHDVGAFHTNPNYGLQWNLWWDGECYLAVFTGPEDLRDTLDQAVAKIRQQK